jgi:hypothetical protein
MNDIISSLSTNGSLRVFYKPQQCGFFYVYFLRIRVGFQNRHGFFKNVIFQKKICILIKNL